MNALREQLQHKTIDEIKGLSNELVKNLPRDPQTKALIDDVKSTLDELTANIPNELLKQLITALRPKIDELLNKVDSAKQDILIEIRSRLTSLLDYIGNDIEEEVAELKEVGIVAWIKGNQVKAGIVVAVVAAAIIASVVGLL